MRTSWTVLISALIALFPLAASSQTDFGSHVAIMTGGQNQGPTRAAAGQALRRCAIELKVADRPMPRIVLLAAGKHEAKVADVRDWGHVFVETHDNGETVYMAWTSEKVTDTDLMQLFTVILNDAFRLGMSDDQAKALSRRMALATSATVNASALAPKRQ